MLILAGVAFLAILILVTKQLSEAAPDIPATAGAVSTAAPIELPEAQLMAAMEAGKPTLAFFHSMTCASCKEMTGIVNQVYPEFADAITLVDVDVYDARNQTLLTRAGIRTIPTTILINRDGTGEVRMGVVQADELRQLLDNLRKGP